jgi:beta-N-acetylhexosaminidase
MTDSLYMEAISKTYTLPQAAVLSVMAGDDLLEGAFDSYSMMGMLAALHNAIADGSISTARIDQSVLRILELKARFGLIPMLQSPEPSTTGATAYVGRVSLPPAWPSERKPAPLPAGFTRRARELASP